jgi:hypothetical protein
MCLVTLRPSLPREKSLDLGGWVHTEPQKICALTQKRTDENNASAQWPLRSAQQQYGICETAVGGEWIPPWLAIKNSPEYLLVQMARSFSLSKYVPQTICNLEVRCGCAEAGIEDSIYAPKTDIAVFYVVLRKEKTSDGPVPSPENSAKIHRIHNFTIVNGYWLQSLICSS